MQVAYTFDAGPNAVMIARNRKTAALLLQRLLYNFPPQSDTDLDRYASEKCLTVGMIFRHPLTNEKWDNLVYQNRYCQHVVMSLCGQVIILDPNFAKNADMSTNC